MRHFFLYLSLIFILFSCYRLPSQDLDPGFHNRIPLQTPSKAPFPDLSPLANPSHTTTWIQEYQLGLGFAKNHDYYRAITCFKRALMLSDDKDPRLHYAIFLAYYLGEQYPKAIQLIEFGPLQNLPQDFPPLEDLTLILIDCYQKTGQIEKAERLLTLVGDKEKKDKAQSFLEATHPTPHFIENPAPYLKEAIKSYQSHALSPIKAQSLNALLPGSGYLYVGQRQSAFTSLALNALFIAATAHFFKKGPIAAGIITGSLELGWYLGGIYGAGLAAKEYNQRLFYKNMHPTFMDKEVYPMLMLEYHF